MQFTIGPYFEFDNALIMFAYLNYQCQKCQFRKSVMTSGTSIGSDILR